VNLFLLFLIGSFLIGLLLPRVPMRVLMIMVAVGCVLAAIGYFYFNRI